LIVACGDEPMAVEVKHNLKTERSEGVAAIREFVGALVGEG
jgi:hypothetical protein